MILNTSIQSIEDAVPDYLRGMSLFRYILDNYGVVKRVDNFLILKKERDDIFSNSIVRKDYKNYLTHIDLENIPASEGKYKLNNRILQNAHVLISTYSSQQINNYLQNHNILTQNLFLIMKPVEQKSTVTQITLSTRNNLTTMISFLSCNPQNSCLMHLDNIPVFYTPRILSNIGISSDFKGEITLLRMADLSRFW